MNNWRWLLLAVVVVVQPIGSFTETNLIDGRECSERFADQLYGYRKTENHRSLDGIRENRRTNEERRLSSLDGNRYWRYETRRGPMLTLSERSLERSETRISPERHRLSRDQERYRKVNGLRVTREGLDKNRNKLKSSMVQNSRESRNGDTLDAAHTVRLLRDARNVRSAERDSRNTMSRQHIRTSRSIDEEAATLQRKREDLIQSDTRPDARTSSATRFDSRNQLDKRENRRSLFSNARVSVDSRVERKLDEGNNRDSRVVRVELRRQRDIELRKEVSVVLRDSRMRESRDKSARLVRDKTNGMKNNRFDERKLERDESRRSTDVHRLQKTEELRLDSQLNRASRGVEITRNAVRMDRRSLSMGRHSTFRESRNSRPSRASDGDTSTTEERACLNRNEGSHGARNQRENRRLSRDRTTLSLREARDSNDRTPESNRIVIRRDARESSEERRQQRDNNLSREMTNISLREVQHTEHTEQSGRNIRESLVERSLQRDSSRISRDSTIYRVRENREVHLENMERTQELRRITSPTRTEINSRKVDSRSRENIRYNERTELRRQVLERITERANQMTRSSSAERRLDISKTSRSAEASRVRDDTRTNERDEHRQTINLDRTFEQRVASHQRTYTTKSSSTENIRHDRAVRKHNDVRGSGDMTVKRIVAQRVTRNVATPQRFDSHSSSRTESIRLERQARNRAEVREIVREEMKRDSDRKSRILLNSRSSERVLEEREQETRDTTKDSRNDRSEMSRNRDEVQIDERFKSRRQHAFSRTSERVLTERRQENPESDSRNVRGETRQLVEARTKRILAERRQENRDSRNVRDENERLVSRRQREVTRESRDLRRQIRDVTERFANRFRESTARAETRNERATRNFERQESDRNLRIADGRGESKSDKQANKAMERMEKTASLFLKRDDAKREETRFRNIDGTFRNDIDSVVKSAESVFGNWQMMFYTLQGVYLCGLLVQMLTENPNKTKKRIFNWWPSPKNIIKVD